MKNSIIIIANNVFTVSDPPPSVRDVDSVFDISGRHIGITILLLAKAIYPKQV